MFKKIVALSFLVLFASCDFSDDSKSSENNNVDGDGGATGAVAEITVAASLSDTNSLCNDGNDDTFTITATAKDASDYPVENASVSYVADRRAIPLNSGETGQKSTDANGEASWTFLQDDGDCKKNGNIPYKVELDSDTSIDDEVSIFQGYTDSR